MAFDMNKYCQQYAETHYDRLTVRLPLGGKDELKALAAAAGISVNQYIIAAINSYKEEH